MPAVDRAAARPARDDRAVQHEHETLVGTDIKFKGCAIGRKFATKPAEDGRRAVEIDRPVVSGVMRPVRLVLSPYPGRLVNRLKRLHIRVAKGQPFRTKRAPDLYPMHLQLQGDTYQQCNNDVFTGHSTFNYRNHDCDLSTFLICQP